MAKITTQGVTGKTLLEYIETLESRLRAIDPDWNLEPESPDGQALSIWAEALASLDEQVQYAYMSRDPMTAQGQALNDIAYYAGITRQQGLFSTATVVIGGVDGTIIPAGSRVRNASSGTVWSLDTSVEIDGPTVANVTAVVRGAIAAPAGTLTEIADPVAGWQSVTNDASAALGRNEESDTQLRIRRNRSVSRPGSNQLDTMAAAVGDLDGVIQTRLYENDRDFADARGMRANSIAVFVLGGDAGEIQQAIAVKKVPGSNMNSDNDIPNEITEEVITPLGNEVNVTFFRPELIDINVQVVIHTTTMPVIVQEEIKQAIVDYSLIGFEAAAGFSKRGFTIGENVSSGRLHTPVNSIVGDNGYVHSILVGAGDPSGTTVEIGFNELAVFDVDNIDVSYIS